MKKKIASTFLAAIMLITAVLMLGGCQKNPEDVKLKTREECEEYIRQKLPFINRAKLRFDREEKVSDDEIIYYFEDEPIGVIFHVTTKKVKTYFDAVVTGYKEETSDDYMKCYYSYISYRVAGVRGELKKLSEENGFLCDWAESPGDGVILGIRTDKPIEELTPILKQLGAIIKEEDHHGLLPKDEIWCYNSDKASDYDKAYAFYLFEKDEVTDKAGREAYIKENKASSAPEQSD